MKDPRVELLVSMQSLIGDAATAILENRPETLDGGSLRCGAKPHFFWIGIARVNTPEGYDRVLQAKKSPVGESFRVCDLAECLDGIERARLLQALIEFGWSFLGE